MQSLRRQIAAMWCVLILVILILAVQITTCECPSRIVGQKIDDFVKKVTSDPLKNKYAH